jgi:hypothetical protein
MACCRSEPADRFINLTILATGVLAFECALSSRSSSFSHRRLRTFRFEACVFFFAIATFSMYGRAAHTLVDEKVKDLSLLLAIAANKFFIARFGQRRLPVRDSSRA